MLTSYVQWISKRISRILLVAVETTVFHNANILDCTGRDPYYGTVVVVGDRIQAVGPSDQVSTPRDATTVDPGA